MPFNPKSKRYNYTNGGEYTLSGNDYIGYFNVENKVARTGRSITNSSQRLQPTSRIATDMYQYEIGNNLIFPDRLIIDSVSLPNDIEEIKIPVNEVVSNKIFTAHLKRLYENTLYLYSQLNIASNDIPNGYLNWIGISAIDPLSAISQKWHPGSDTTVNYEYANVGYESIDRTKSGVTVRSSNGKDYISFLVSDTILSVISSKADKSQTLAVLATSSIDLNSDRIFSKIEDISTDDKYLFITDSGANCVYKYDISGYITSDSTLYNKIYLVDVIGQFGDSTDKGGFNEPTIIESSESRVYIYDKDNNCIKIYTKDFTWVNTFILQNYEVIDIKYNSFHNTVFVLVKIGRAHV